jgi:hypothetical protein
VRIWLRKWVRCVIGNGYTDRSPLPPRRLRGGDDGIVGDSGARKDAPRVFAQLRPNNATTPARYPAVPTGRGARGETRSASDAIRLRDCADEEVVARGPGSAARRDGNRRILSGRRPRTAVVRAQMRTTEAEIRTAEAARCAYAFSCWVARRRPGETVRAPRPALRRLGVDVVEAVQHEYRRR